MDRISACDTLSKRNESDPFLKRFVTDDEWIVYNNITRKRPWSGPAGPAQTIAKAGRSAYRLQAHVSDRRDFEKMDQQFRNGKCIAFSQLSRGWST